MATEALGALQLYLRETRLLGSINSCLYWDQNTTMPTAAAAWRGEQLALLAGQLHKRQCSPAYAALIAAAEQSLDQLDGAERPGWQRNLQLLREQLERQRKLDPQLVQHLAAARSRGYSLWQQARSDDDFALFAPALEELIRLRLEQARQLAEPRSPWETLAQPFEPDLFHGRLGELFAPLHQRLPVLMERIRSRQRLEPPAWSLPEPLQLDLCNQLLRAWGFDSSQCVLARSPHPFSVTLGPNDFRITLRCAVDQPLSAILAVAHEWGHSLYEQSLPRGQAQWFAWPLGDATSMGVHESQSLFWENRVARSRAFAERWAPRFAERLGAAPWGDGCGFWQAMNPMKPGLTRVEADELSYCLHILLRYQLEIELLEQGLPVAELPRRWTALMQDKLGLIPPSDSLGCLQDVHWSEGLFGYFPSYALGHLISAQLAEAMEAAIGSIDDHIAAAEEATLLAWLRQHVHPLGRSVNAEQLVEHVTGRPLSAQPFLTYLEKKLERLLACS